MKKQMALIALFLFGYSYTAHFSSLSQETRYIDLTNKSGFVVEVCSENPLNIQNNEIYFLAHGDTKKDIAFRNGIIVETSLSEPSYSKKFLIPENDIKKYVLTFALGGEFELAEVSQQKEDGRITIINRTKEPLLIHAEDASYAVQHQLCVHASDIVQPHQSNRVPYNPYLRYMAIRATSMMGSAAYIAYRKDGNPIKIPDGATEVAIEMQYVAQATKMQVDE